MGILDELFGIDNILGDQDFASDMLKDSKFAVTSLAKAVTVVTNPQLRELLENELLTAIDEHHQLSDIATSRDWYKPFLAPQEQVSNDLEASLNL